MNGGVSQPHAPTEWSHALSVGIEGIDEQHRVPVDPLNQLHASIVEHHATKDAPAILDRLVEYTHIHFAVEESLMHLFDYPEYEEHEHSLEALIDEAMQSRLFSEGRPITFELLHFLKKWLTGHIMEGDARYTSYFLSCGVRAHLRRRCGCNGSGSTEDRTRPCRVALAQGACGTTATASSNACASVREFVDWRSASPMGASTTPIATARPSTRIAIGRPTAARVTSRMRLAPAALNLKSTLHPPAWHPWMPTATMSRAPITMFGSMYRRPTDGTPSCCCQPARGWIEPRWNCTPSFAGYEDSSPWQAANARLAPSHTQSHAARINAPTCPASGSRTAARWARAARPGRATNAHQTASGTANARPAVASARVGITRMMVFVFMSAPIGAAATPVKSSGPGPGETEGGCAPAAAVARAAVAGLRMCEPVLVDVHQPRAQYADKRRGLGQWRHRPSRRSTERQRSFPFPLS
ncbi:bacteriohemerythrin [Dyella sp. Sa]|uniref:Bacteriohemerythrin n=1 Tax=Dyella lutea TaxID=2950441 RepID=A0ABT1F7B7_9GAMM|nr:bacteriohemerythrin [Dyella lutea]MCP1373286.1 bacteriohemerythrin [Dyella lutea]